MIFARERSRRDFCNLMLFAGLSPLLQKFSQSLPQRRFELGSRVKITWICDDDRSSDFGYQMWEGGFVVGYCWQYPDWCESDFQAGWTYFVRFDQSDDRHKIPEPYIDFEHESRLAIA